MNEFMTIVLGALSTVVGSSVVYVFMRRKNRADAQKTELDNVDKAVSIWRNLAQDLEKKITELEDKIKQLEDSNARKCESCKYRKFYNENKDKF